jgi:hypothetical protein
MKIKTNQELMNAKRIQLEAVFNKLCDPHDWKAPIDCTCRPEDVNLVREAVVYFTATEPAFSTIEGANVLQVRALGYRQGPAGDH